MNSVNNVAALQISCEELQRSLLEESIVVIDVRTRTDYDAAGTMIAGAVRRDPDQIASWSRQLPTDSDRIFVVYCAHGRRVSASAAEQLHAAGLRAFFLSGGVTAWTEAGLPLSAKK